MQEVLILSRTLHKHDDILSNSSSFFRGWGSGGLLVFVRTPSQPSCSESDGDDWIIQSRQALSLCLCLHSSSQTLSCHSHSSFSPPVPAAWWHSQMLLSCCLFIMISVCWRDCSGFLLRGVARCLSNRECVTGSRWWSAWPLFGDSGLSKDTEEKLCTAVPVQPSSSIRSWKEH